MGDTIRLSESPANATRDGEVVGGKYRLERELGRGAMGTVWAATHVTLGQRVAIKIIAAEHARSGEARARFSTEAKAAARLKSRYAVQVYDDGETSEGTPYIVMEYLEGETLEARLAREHELPLVDAVRITAQVARALGRAHAVGIVHRDLKPGNVFLARNDEDELGWTAKVLDFGIAKLNDPGKLSTTKTGALLGTPLFMSPEQVRGASDVDGRSDLYSLGICFYSMLTGRFAFDRPAFPDILLAIVSAPLPNLQVNASTASQTVSLWFERCCARDPAERFQSADELLEALQLAVGPSIVVTSRVLIPGEQRGPSGTIRGHSPPLSPSTRVIGTEDSGQYSLPSLDPVANNPPARLGSSAGTGSVVTMSAERPATRPRPPSVWLIAAIAGALLVIAIGLVRTHSSGSSLHAPPTVTESAPPASPVTPIATITSESSTATTASAAAPPSAENPSIPPAPASAAAAPEPKPAQNPLKSHVPASRTPVAAVTAPPARAPASHNTDLGF